MPEIPIEAIALPTFVVERGVIVTCNAAAQRLAAHDLVGSEFNDLFDATDDGYARLERDGAITWYRLDTNESG